MRLEDLYNLLLERAKATQAKQAADLPGGARLGVAVAAQPDHAGPQSHR